MEYFNNSIFMKDESTQRVLMYYSDVTRVHLSSLLFSRVVTQWKDYITIHQEWLWLSAVGPRIQIYLYLSEVFFVLMQTLGLGYNCSYEWQIAAQTVGENVKEYLFERVASSKLDSHLLILLKCIVTLC